LHVICEGRNSNPESFTYSPNGDWKTWMVSHDNSEVAIDDFRGVRKAIDVNFKGDSVNMFNVLSRVEFRGG